MKKDLLKMDDLSKEEILDILNLADQLKYELKHDIAHAHLKGKTLGMIFEKSFINFKSLLSIPRSSSAESDKISQILTRIS